LSVAIWKENASLCLKCGPPLMPMTGNAHDGELHRQLIARLAARKVDGRLVNGGHFGIRKGGGVETRGFMGVAVVPETDRVLRLHVPVLPLSVMSRLWRFGIHRRCGVVELSGG
jgi:hypothetical protein